MDIKGKQISLSNKSIAFGDSSNSLSEDTLFTFDSTGKLLGVGTSSPLAALDITSTTKGALIPRMTTAQRNLMTGVVTSTLIFNTDATTPQFEYWNGSSWSPIVSTVPTTTLDPVLSNTIATPPGSPVIGDRYLIPASPTGAWAGLTNQIVEWSGSAWTPTLPIVDNTVYVIDTLTTYRYNGTNWVLFTNTSLTLTGFLQANQTRTVSSVIAPGAGVSTATINWNNGSRVILNLRNTTTNVTLTLTNPLDTATYSITVIDHLTVNRSVIFPVGTIGVDGQGNTVIADLPATRYKVVLEYHSTDPIIGTPHYEYTIIPNIA